MNRSRPFAFPFVELLMVVAILCALAIAAAPYILGRAL